ncbi:MAG: F0F1 ATP synthase subunit delta [Patescibacteria group bacterium]
MKYPVELYAEAFSEVASRALTSEKEKTLVKNFIALIERSGDIHHIQKIVAHTEKLLRIKTGKRKVTVESARPLKESAIKTLKEFIEKSDLIEEKINPNLVAGIKLTVNDEMEFDGSFASKIRALFKNLIGN